jgi:DNA-binding MarR family transcriptional regulator
MHAAITLGATFKNSPPAEMFSLDEQRGSNEQLNARHAVGAKSAYSSAGCPSEQRILGILKARRSRDKYFKDEIFADPAWDILLELYAAELGQRRICVSSLCVGAAVPPTTGLRWIKTLEAKGLICRTDDRFDHRRHYMSLTPQASSAMTAYFRALPEGSI